MGYDTALDSGGNLYVAAESYSNGNCAVVLKFSSSGSLLAAYSYKGPATYDSGYSIDVDKSGDVILAGTSWDYSVYPNHNSILLVKFDNEGRSLWNKNIVTGAEDEAGGSKVVRFDSSGDIYLAAHRASVCQSSNFATCNFDADLFKLDANGNLLWATSWGGSGWESSGGLVFDEVGNLVVTGTTQSFLGGISSAMLLQYDPFGNLLASGGSPVSRIWGGNGSVTLGGSSVDTAGGILAAGSALNNTGTWQNVVGTTGTPTPTITSLGITGSPSGTVGTPTGTTTSPTGVLDTGGGGADALLIRTALSATPAKPVVIVVPGFGASTLTDMGGSDQWLSCSTISILSGGFLRHLQYNASGQPLTSGLTATSILTQNDSISPFVKPSNQSVLQCSTTDLVNDVVCTSSSAHECLEAHAAALDGKRALIQLNIVSDSSGDFLQFNSPVGADLLDFLTGAGYGPTTCSGVGPCAPEVFPYDFRRDIAALAEDLYTKIKQVASDSPGRPVAIVTHSMGSLVTAAMIAQHRDLYTSGLLNTVISMGAPFAGGLTTYLYAQGFRAFTPFLSASNTALLGNNWTSVYELLPQWQFLTPNPLGLSLDSIYQGAYDPIDLPGLPRAQQQDLINQRDNVWNEISNLGGNINGLASEPFWNAIIGYSQPTASEIDKSSNLGFDSVSTPIFALSKPCYTLQLDDGDGEVPLTASAQGSLIPARRIYVQEQHAMLPQNAAVAHGILNILNGASPFTVSGLLSEDDFVNLRKMQPFAVKNTILINSCSPLTVSAEDSSGDIINSQVSQIQGAKYANVGDATQIELPWNDTFTIIVTGTGTGTFDLVVRGFGGQHAPLGYIFKAVPVRTGSQGIVTVGGSSVPTLQYNYAGKNIIDTIPANVNPPTILCTGCYFITQNLRATFAFNVGYLGGVSTFTYNYRSSSQTVQFVSTKTSQISVSGNTANFSGEGTLNGQTGYSFAIAAKDGGAAGSGLDTVSITITGPNSYSYTANATVAGGDVVVHQ